MRILEAPGARSIPLICAGRGIRTSALTDGMRLLAVTTDGTRESGEYDIPCSDVPAGSAVVPLAGRVAVRSRGGVKISRCRIWGGFRLPQGALGVPDPRSQQPGSPGLQDSRPQQFDRPVTVAEC